MMPYQSFRTSQVYIYSGIYFGIYSWICFWIFSWTFYGCGSANVIVTPKGPNSSFGNEYTNNAGFGAGIPQRSSSTENVYFQRVWVDHGTIQTILAISFASPNSTTEIPFGFSIRLQKNLGIEKDSSINAVNNSVFSLDSHQLAYLRTNGEGGATLMSTTESSLSSQILAEFPVPIAGFSLSRLTNQVAWINMQGRVFVSKLPTQLSRRISPFSDDQTSSLFLPRSEDGAISVGWNPLASILLVRTLTGRSLFYSQHSSGLQLSMEVKDTVASVFSPDSSHVAWVSQDHSLFLSDLSSGRSIINTPASSLKLFNSQKNIRVWDVSWSIENAISYWIHPESGADTIQTLDPATGTEKTLAQLSLPSGANPGIGNGIVCPVWLGNTLYFGNYLNGMYLIERIRFGNDQKGIREIFASPPAPDEGFICPTLARMRST